MKAFMPIGRHRVGYLSGRQAHVVFVGDGCVIRSGDFNLRLDARRTASFCDTMSEVLKNESEALLGPLLQQDAPEIWLTRGSMLDLVADHSARSRFGDLIPAGRFSFTAIVAPAMDEYDWCGAGFRSHELFRFTASRLRGVTSITWTLEPFGKNASFDVDASLATKLTTSIRAALAGRQGSHAIPAGPGAIILDYANLRCRIGSRAAAGLARWLSDTKQEDAHD